jgi:hypothetical protein
MASNYPEGMTTADLVHAGELPDDHEHEYIPAPGTEGDSYGPLICEHCGLSAEEDPEPDPDLLHDRRAEGVD